MRYHLGARCHEPCTGSSLTEKSCGGAIRILSTRGRCTYRILHAIYSARSYARLSSSRLPLDPLMRRLFEVIGVELRIFAPPLRHGALFKDGRHRARWFTCPAIDALI